MNSIINIFSWLRELGLVLLTISLFQIWFISRRFNHAVTGIELSTHDFLAFLCHFLIFSTYLISQFRSAIIWRWAIAFSIVALVFHAYLALSLSLGDRTPLAHSLGIGGTTIDMPLNQVDSSLLLSRVGMAALAVGLFASMNGNSRKKYVAGTTIGCIVASLISTPFVYIPYVGLLAWLVGTSVGVGVGQRVEHPTLSQQKN